MGSVLTAVEFVAWGVCAPLCCCGLYQVLVWLLLWLMGYSPFSEILLARDTFLSFTIIYEIVIVVTFANSNRVDDINSSFVGLVLFLFTALCMVSVSIDFLLVTLNVSKKGLAEIENRDERNAFYIMYVFVTFILFCFGISKTIVWLSELHLFFLFFLSMLLGFCLSSTAHKWIKSDFPKVVEIFGFLSKEAKALLCSFLICSVVIKASNQSYGTSEFWTKSYVEGKGNTKVLIKPDALKLDETNTCPTFDGNEARVIIDGEWIIRACKKTEWTNKIKLHHVTKFSSCLFEYHSIVRKAQVISIIQRFHTKARYPVGKK